MVIRHLLIIEDNRILRESIVNGVTNVPDIQFVTQMDSDINRNKIIALQPDIIVLGVSLYNLCSKDIIEFIHSDLPGSKIVLMDLIPKHTQVIEFVRLGVSGFVLKDTSIENLLITIRSVAKGKKILPQILLENLFSQIIQGDDTTESPQIMALPELTCREREVIERVVRGFSNKEIADGLSVSVDTIKSHVHHILEKLSLVRRSQIAAYLQKYEILKTKFSAR